MDEKRDPKVIWTELINKAASEKQTAAAERYDELMSQDFIKRHFRFATEGKSDKYAEALKGDALALCGDPYNALSGRKWGTDALYFLLSFREA